VLEQSFSFHEKNCHGGESMISQFYIASVLIRYQNNLYFARKYNSRLIFTGDRLPRSNHSLDNMRLFKLASAKK